MLQGSHHIWQFLYGGCNHKGGDANKSPQWWHVVEKYTNEDVELRQGLTSTSEFIDGISKGMHDSFISVMICYCWVATIGACLWLRYGTVLGAECCLLRSSLRLAADSMTRRSF
jgi:hypothetical protein